jgi:hypothetical protein
MLSIRTPRGRQLIVRFANLLEGFQLTKSVTGGYAELFQ